MFRSASAQSSLSSMDGLNFGESASSHGHVVVILARSIGLIVFIAAIILLFLVCLFARYVIIMCVDAVGVSGVLLAMSIFFAVVFHLAQVNINTFVTLFRRMCH